MSVPPQDSDPFLLSKHGGRTSSWHNMYANQQASGCRKTTRGKASPSYECFSDQLKSVKILSPYSIYLPGWKSHRCPSGNMIWCSAKSYNIDIQFEPEGWRVTCAQQEKELSPNLQCEILCPEFRIIAFYNAASPSVSDWQQMMWIKQ